MSDKPIFTYLLKNRIVELGNLENIISNLVDCSNLNEKKSYQLNLILEELISNTIFYGYPENSEDSIELKIIQENEFLIIEIVDGGIAFNPLEAEEKEDNLDELKVGGLGIKLVKKLCHKMDYQRINNRNHLKIHFKYA
ncbi:MAG: ATP-binding protein [Bacteroidales bacterium]|nr:ATP-binding protein [Bacteroidales bacterium]